MNVRSCRLLATLAVVVPALVLACGGAEPPAASPSDATGSIATGTSPPPLPPSMAAKGGPASPAGAPPAAGGGAGAEDVARGQKAFEAGDLATARASFEAALKKNPADVDALYSLGLTLEKAGDRAGAEKSYREALKRKPDHEAAAVNLSALLVDGDKQDEAAAVARAALAKHGENTALRLNLALALAAKGDSAGATKELDEIIRKNPKDAVVRLTYGHWLGVWKQREAAVRELLAAKSLANDDRGVVAQVGEELRVLGALPECIAAYGRAIELKDAAELRTGRALCKLAAKDEAGALADLQAAVAKEPKYPLAHYYLGGRHAAAGKWKEVVAEYETYLKLQPDGAFARQATERVRIARERLSGKK